MVHIAIMKKSWGLLEKILSGEKVVETRWYKNKSRPWNSIKENDIIYFKNSGEEVTIKAEVEKVEQYENLDEIKIVRLLNKFSQKDLGTTDISDEIKKYVSDKKYAIIIHLKNPKKITSFQIDKTGYGAMSAWICCEDLNKIKI